MFINRECLYGCKVYLLSNKRVNRRAPKLNYRVISSNFIFNYSQFLGIIHRNYL